GRLEAEERLRLPAGEAQALEPGRGSQAALRPVVLAGEDEAGLGVHPEAPLQAAVGARPQLEPPRLAAGDRLRGGDGDVVIVGQQVELVIGAQPLDARGRAVALPRLVAALVVDPFPLAVRDGEL